MFSAFGGLAPRFETRRALLILNMQNDSFDVRAGNMMVNPDHDFADRIRAMVPFYRRLGDIVWVRTEYAVDRPSSPEHSAASTGDDDGVPTASSSPASRHEAELPAPSGRAQKAMRKAAARARTRQRSGVLGEIDQDDDAAEADAYLKKPRKGQRPAIYCAGTRGAAIIDSLLPLVDERTDMMVVKHHYSALDATPLLMALRMKLVTHLYLCGCLSNVSILTTAQDAVRHGFEVTVVEDCMGYRSEVKHLEVMRMMADLLGVSGTDSEEIIDDAGGRDPPDADELVITGPGLEGIKGSVVQAPGSRPQSIGGREKLEFRSRTAEAPTAKDQEHHEISHVEHARPSAPTSTSKDRIGEGDSSIIYDVLSPSLVADAFGKIRDEVQWQAMLHRSGEVPRRVAVQGWVDHERNRPLYRHPADFAPPLLHFTETVDRIRLELAKCLRQPFNHVLIQLYRDGEDNISEHSDKTLDILRGSNIANVSLGAQRTMTLRTKKARGPQSATAIRNTQKVPMPHNSVFVLGASTNQRWLHGIRPDKRRPAERLAEEKAFGGVRISLTFRLIVTYTNEDHTKIWGQGASSKFPVPPSDVRTDDPRRVQEMITAFGKENREADFDWDAAYGAGFDVINTVSPPPITFDDVPKADSTSSASASSEKASDV